jgi:hypothetical protein
MNRITQVKVLDDYRLELTFGNGVHGVVVLSDLVGSGVFRLWSDYREFQKVKISDTGDLTWSGQVDLCPDALYLKVTGKRPEDVFPILKREPVNA